MSKKTKLPGVAIVGCTRLSEFLANALRSSGFSIEAIADVRSDLAQRFAQRLCVKYYTDDFDLLWKRSDVQMIVFTWPHFIYPEMVTKAILAGKHILMDWPSTLHITEIQAFVKEPFDHNNQVAMLVHPMRFLKQFILMRQLIQKHYFIGDLQVMNVKISGNFTGLDMKYLLEDKKACESYERDIDWQLKGIGALDQVGVHIIDLITFITNHRAVRVSSTLKTLNEVTEPLNPVGIRRYQYEDYVHFNAELVADIVTPCNKSGGKPLAVVNINANRVFDKLEYEITVLGTGGYLKIVNGHLTGRKVGMTGSVTTFTHENELRLHCGLDEVEDHNDKIDMTKSVLSSKNLLYYDRKAPVPYLIGMSGVVNAMKTAITEKIATNKENCAKNDEDNCDEDNVNKAQKPEQSVQCQENEKNKPNQSSNKKMIVPNLPNNKGYIDFEDEFIDDEEFDDFNDDPMFSNKECEDDFRGQVKNCAIIEDGVYIQSVLEAIRSSSRNCEWTRVKYSSCLSKKKEMIFKDNEDC